MAPEVYQCDLFDFRIDVWTLVLIFDYTLSEGKHSFRDGCNKRTVPIRRKEPILIVKEDLKVLNSKDGYAFRLIEPMLKVNPFKRQTVSDLPKESNSSYSTCGR